jgi:tyrosyl-DNA phosphodiesterase-1
VYEWDWLQKYLCNFTGELMAVVHTREMHQGSTRVSENRVLVVPPLEQWGCMHVKFLLGFTRNSLRVVLSSANLIRIDWEELENSVVVQDFPLKIDDGCTLFEEDLKKILRDMKIPDDVIKKVGNYDFKKAKGKLVFSKPGKYSVKDYGMLKLSQIVKEMSLKQEVDRQVFYQTSSLGSTSETWIRDFYSSCMGLEPASLGKKRKKDSDLPPLRILFPSQDTVKFSSCIQGASSICFNRKYWKNFPKQVIRHCHSLNGGLMHSKIILSLEKDLDIGSGKLYIRDEEEPGDSWIYIGSHNCTLSAWGSITKSKDIYMRNWELGIIFGVSDIISDEEVTIPFVFPPKTYLPDQEPWVNLCD